MGGKSSSDNSEIVNLQKEEAAQARLKEEDRKRRIAQGTAAIADAFEGKSKYKTVAGAPYKVKDPAWGTQSGAAVTGLPTGFKYIQQPGASVTAGGAGSRLSNPATNPLQPGQRRHFTANDLRDSAMTAESGGGGSGGTAAATPGKWVIQGPDGKIYEVGSDIATASKNVFAGREKGGFDEGYFNEYKHGVEDYLLPQVQRQFIDARDNLTNQYADAGTSKSSMATKAMADLARQKLEQEADVRKTAETATGGLVTRVNKERANAEAQLAATEDPTKAANTALALVKNISLDTPAVSPLGEIFKTALVGGANAITGYKNQQGINQVRQAAADAARVYGS